MRTLLLIALAISVAGCKKKATPVASSGPATTTESAGGGSTVSTVRNAVQRKAVNSNDMSQIRLFIDTASGASGKMPTPAETLAALKKEMPTVAALVEDGSIVLCSAKNREAVWAYESKALTTKGWVAMSSGIEEMTSEALKARLNQ